MKRFDSNNLFNCFNLLYKAVIDILQLQEHFHGFPEVSKNCPNSEKHQSAIPLSNFLNVYTVFLIQDFMPASTLPGIKLSHFIQLTKKFKLNNTKSNHT